MKFGDIVINEWASDRNPHKVLMFVRKTKRYIHCLAIKGEEVKFCNDSGLKLSKTASLNLLEWECEIASRLKLSEEFWNENEEDE